MQLPLVKGNYCAKADGGKSGRGEKRKAESGKRKQGRLGWQKKGAAARLGQKNGGQKNADPARGRNQ